MRRAVEEAQAAWEDKRVHTWVVSYRTPNRYMNAMLHGDGKRFYVPTTDQFVPVYQEIANSLPLLLFD
jgi:hypothetical protein